MRSRTLVVISLLLSCTAVARSAFTFEFEIVRHHTNGDCFGMDLSIPCETFVTDFCLRGPSFVGTTIADLAQCPLGVNGNRVFQDAPQTRTIESNQPWLVSDTLTTKIIVKSLPHFSDHNRVGLLPPT